jgi:Zn-dependent peptidase ImmA (M78 family)/transcriptional regulator with XRE-family HTH domain
MPKGVHVKGVNPEVLSWARTTSGWSIEAVAKRLGRKTEDVENWEDGSAAPTYAQLERLAYEVYKRPLALFFFPAPPEEPSPQEAFRALPDTLLNDLPSDTMFALREAQAYLASINDLTEGQNPSPTPIFRDVGASMNEQHPAQLAREARQFLGVGIEDQLSWRSTDVAFSHWRAAIEAAGVFVFSRPFKQREIVGFSLLDSKFPLIVVSNSHARSRQIFTLFHELAHVLVGVNDLTYEEALDPPQSSNGYWAIERYCNAFAGEFLAPWGFLEERAAEEGLSTSFIEKHAHLLAVSREVIARRLLDHGRLSHEQYRELAERFNAEYEEHKKSQKGGGGNYYNNIAFYLGDTYLNLAFSAHFRGRTTTEQLANQLGVKPKSVAGLEELWRRRVSTQ